MDSCETVLRHHYRLGPEGDFHLKGSMSGMTIEFDDAVVIGEPSSHASPSNRDFTASDLFRARHDSCPPRNCSKMHGTPPCQDKCSSPRARPARLQRLLRSTWYSRSGTRLPGRRRSLSFRGSREHWRRVGNAHDARHRRARSVRLPRRSGTVLYVARRQTSSRLARFRDRRWARAAPRVCGPPRRSSGQNRSEI